MNDSRLEKTKEIISKIVLVEVMLLIDISPDEMDKFLKKEIS